jgi:hypothetical protein
MSHPESAARTKALAQLENTLGHYAPSVITSAFDRIGVHSKTPPLGVSSFAPKPAAPITPEQQKAKTEELKLSPDELKDSGERVLERLMKMKGLNMEKKSSIEGVDLAVSEACLGRMLSDRHCMYKHANAVTKAVDALKPSAGHLGEYFKFMAIPLAIGGGIQLVSKLMEQKETTKMKQESERVYASLLRSNEKFSSNKEIADEAFDALRSFAPALATKPIVARTFIENTIDGSVNDKHGRLAPETAKMLTETQDLVNRLNNASGGGFLAGLKDNMSIFSHAIKAPGKRQ